MAHAEVQAQLAANEARQRELADLAARRQRGIADGVAAQQKEIMEAGGGSALQSSG